MGEIAIRKIGANSAADARLPNEPFPIWGRIIPSLLDGVWTYRVERSSETGEDVFPDEPYDPATDDAVFFGAYDGETCVGLAVLREDLARYLYLDDLIIDSCKDRDVNPN